MSSSNQEFKGLLEDKITPKGNSLFCLMPLVSSSILILFTSLSLVISLFRQNFLQIGELSHSSLMPIGIFISTLPGFITICALHFMFFERRFGQKNCFFVFSSFVSGMTAQVSLVFISFKPSSIEPSWDLVFDERDLALAVFMISSLLFETFSFSLNIEKDSYKRLSLKSKLISVIILLTLVQGAIALYLQVYSEEWLELISDILDYIMFYAHLVYFSTYYYDLQDINLSFFLKQEYDDLVNSSTF